MALWLTRCCLVYYDDMVRPPPLALAATHPLVRAAVESNGAVDGCGVFQACGLRVSLRRAYEDGGFSAYRSVLTSVTGNELGAHVDVSRRGGTDLAVHRYEDDQVQQREQAIYAADCTPSLVMDCQAAVPRCVPHSARDKDTFYQSAFGTALRACAEGTAGSSHVEPAAETATEARGRSGAPRATGASAALGSSAVEDVTSRARHDKAPVLHPFFTEATPRAALPPLRRVVHAPYEPRIPFVLLEAMGWWLWRPSTQAPLEYIGSAFVGHFPVVHKGTELATLFTREPQQQQRSSPTVGTGALMMGVRREPLSFAQLPDRPSLVSLRIRGFAHLRNCLYTEPVADLAAIAEAAPQLQLMQLTGLAPLDVGDHVSRPFAFQFLFLLDLSNTRVHTLDFLRHRGRRAPPRQPEHDAADASTSPFPFLRVLNISGCEGVTHLLALPELPALVVLIAARLEALAAVDPLADCALLEEVDISGCVCLVSLAPLARCRRLRALRARSCAMLRSLGALLLDSPATATLEYLNVSESPLLSSLFHLDESDTFVEAQWQQQRGQRTDSAQPHAHCRTSLRYLNVARTGLCWQTVENLLRLEALGMSHARTWTSHLLYWIAVLCPRIEQLDISHCAPRPWTLEGSGGGGGVRLPVGDNPAQTTGSQFDDRLREAERVTGLSASKTPTIDLSPLLGLAKMQKLVVSGMHRITFTAPTPHWCVLGCALFADSDGAAGGAADTAGAVHMDAPRLRWLEASGSELALPLVLKVVAETGGLEAAVRLDAPDVRRQLARDQTVQWLRHCAHACFHLSIPFFTTADALEMHKAAAAMGDELPCALRDLVLSEVWKPVQAVTKASAVTPTVGDGAAANLVHDVSPALFRSPSWGTVHSGMVSGVSRSTFLCVSFTDPGPPVEVQSGSRLPSAAQLFASSPPPRGEFPAEDECALRQLAVCTRFLSSHEVTADVDATARTARRCVPFFIAPQLRRITLTEPPHCAPCARRPTAESGAVNLDTSTEDDAPREVGDGGDDDNRHVWTRPEDFLTTALFPDAVLASLHPDQPTYASPLPEAAHTTAATSSPAESASFDLSGRSLNPVRRGDEVGELAQGPAGNGSRHVRRVDVEALALLLQSFPFVEALTLEQCSRTLRSLTPLFCLPRPLPFEAAPAGETEVCAEDLEAMRRRALFEACTRATTASVASPFRSFKSLRVLDATLATSLTSLGPLVCCCPLLEKVSLRSCLRLRSLRGLHGATRLRFLDVRATGITGVVGLGEKCPRLAWLDVSGCRQLTDLSGLCGAPQLHYLRARRVPNLETLLHLDDAFYAEVAGAAGGACPAPAPHFPQLVELDLCGCESLVSLASIGMAPRLERCQADGRKLQVLPLARVQCPSLKQVGLFSAYRLTTLAPLAGAPQLRELKVFVCGVQCVDGLADCPLLSSLEIKTCRSLQSIRGVVGAPSLSLLILDNSTVRDLGELDKCVALEHVSVVGCPFADSAVLQRLRNRGVTVREQSDE